MGNKPQQPVQTTQQTTPSYTMQLGPSTTQQTTPSVTSQVLSPEQQAVLDAAMPGIKNFAANVPQRYQGETVAGFTAPQVAGQQMALGAAGTQADLSNRANQASNFFTSGDIWNPTSNPALQGSIDAATRPIMDNLLESVLPAIRGEAVKTGNFGSSRQGISEGIASREASRAIGDTTSKITEDLYKTNIGAQLQALGLLPTLQAGAVAPAMTTSAVGDVQQALEQARINANVANFNYDQLAPYLQSKELLSILGSVPGGGTVSNQGSTSSWQGPTQSMGGSITSTGTVPQPTLQSMLTSSLGGAASGAALGTAFGLPGVGAAGGALLPFIFS